MGIRRLHASFRRVSCGGWSLLRIRKSGGSSFHRSFVVKHVGRSRWAPTGSNELLTLLSDLNRCRR